VVEIDDYEVADMREAAKDSPKYDVAISFLAKDQQVVEPIAEALGEGLKSLSGNIARPGIAS
jgi:hypothetical protein